MVRVSRIDPTVRRSNLNRSCTSPKSDLLKKKPDANQPFSMIFSDPPGWLIGQFSSWLVKMCTLRNAAIAGKKGITSVHERVEAKDS